MDDFQVVSRRKKNKKATSRHKEEDECTFQKGIDLRMHADKRVTIRKINEAKYVIRDH